MPEWMHNRAEVLEGELLGDASLLTPKRGTNAVFQLQAKARGQVLFAYAGLAFLGGRPHSFTRKSSGYRKTPTQMWHWRSCTDPVLTENLKRWYINGIKIVPADFILTPISALHWYIGDGSLHKKHAQITFCTDNFDELSIRRLEVRLRENGFQPGRRLTKKGHTCLSLTGACVDKFLAWIGPCPVPEMVHKWSLVARRYATKRVSAVEHEKMRMLRLSGLSYSEVSRLMGRTIAAVHEAVNGRARHA